LPEQQAKLKSETGPKDGGGCHDADGKSITPNGCDVSGGRGRRTLKIRATQYSPNSKARVRLGGTFQPVDLIPFSDGLNSESPVTNLNLRTRGQSAFIDSFCLRS
jgi:hypothetical protein